MGVAASAISNPTSKKSADKRLPPPTVPTAIAEGAAPLGVVEEEFSYADDEELMEAIINGELEETGAGSALSDQHRYKVELGADTHMKIPGASGELRVWIGAPDYAANFPEGMSTTTDTLPAIGSTAMVTPFAPAFEVKPKESICMKIHPSGSDIRFELIPLKKGSFKVGADVRLFDSEDCSGIPVPKAVTSLNVEVVVDKSEVIQAHSQELWAVFWGKFLEFWAAIIALFFAVLLFLIKGKLKQWLGFQGKGE